MKTYYLVMVPLAVVAMCLMFRRRPVTPATILASLEPVTVDPAVLAWWDRWTQAQMIYRYDLHLFVPGLRDEAAIREREALAAQLDAARAARRYQKVVELARWLA